MWATSNRWHPFFWTVFYLLFPHMGTSIFKNGKWGKLKRPSPGFSHSWFSVLAPLPYKVERGRGPTMLSEASSLLRRKTSPCYPSLGLRAKPWCSLRECKQLHWIPASVTATLTLGRQKRDLSVIISKHRQNRNTLYAIKMTRHPLTLVNRIDWNVFTSYSFCLAVVLLYF